MVDNSVPHDTLSDHIRNKSRCYETSQDGEISIYKLKSVYVHGCMCVSVYVS